MGKQRTGSQVGFVSSVGVFQGWSDSTQQQPPNFFVTVFSKSPQTLQRQLLTYVPPQSILQVYNGAQKPTVNWQLRRTCSEQVTAAIHHRWHCHSGQAQKLQTGSHLLSKKCCCALVGFDCLPVVTPCCNGLLPGLLKSLAWLL